MITITKTMTDKEWAEELAELYAIAVEDVDQNYVDIDWHHDDVDKTNEAYWAVFYEMCKDIYADIDKHMDLLEMVAGS